MMNVAPALVRRSNLLYRRGVVGIVANDDRQKDLPPP